MQIYMDEPNFVIFKHYTCSHVTHVDIYALLSAYIIIAVIVGVATTQCQPYCSNIIKFYSLKVAGK